MCNHALKEFHNSQECQTKMINASHLWMNLVHFKEKKNHFDSIQKEPIKSHIKVLNINSYTKGRST